MRNTLRMLLFGGRPWWERLYVSDGSAATPGRFYWLWATDSRMIWG